MMRYLVHIGIPASAEFVFGIAVFVLAGCVSGKPKVSTLEPFTTDLCSRYREGPRDNRSQWAHCCVAHDIRYWRGGSWEERVAADHELERCVADTGAERESQVMYSGVRVGGGAVWPTPYRWGYGWESRKVYRPLTTGERAMVETAWSAREYRFLSLPPFLVDLDAYSFSREVQ